MYIKLEKRYLKGAYRNITNFQNVVQRVNIKVSGVSGC